jgi:integrase
MKKLVDSEGRPQDQDKDRIPSRDEVRKSYSKAYNRDFEKQIAGLKALTAKRMAKLEPGRYRDRGARGLYLQVRPSGTQSWLLRYEVNGRERWHGLGSAADFALKEARERARRARQFLADGIDPIDAKRAARAAAALEAAKAMTFEQATREYLKQHEKKWRSPKSSPQFLSSMTAYVLPRLGGLSVADIDTGLVLKVLEPIWMEKTETASRVRSRIEAVLDWATVRGYRTGDNPARWRGHLSEVLPAPEKIKKRAHHAALPFIEMPRFTTELRAHEGVAARALEFCILTAARSGEVRGARWDEMEFDARVWRVPGSRMKGGQPHAVPLSERALEILRGLPREDGADHVFLGGTRGAGLAKMSMANLLKRMGRDDITVHGFRSTFRDWAAERTGFPNHIVEMALAHTLGAVERAYRRGELLDKRRRLMDDWATFATSKPTTAEVVGIRSAAK